MTITSQQVDAWDAEVDAAYASGVAAGAAAEREACAKVIEGYDDHTWGMLMQDECAEAIRARGNT